ncbi:uncharacterized protein ACN63O_000316 [Diretmus argenteus]
MAHRGKEEKNAVLNRSVSFKKLESWSANRSEEQQQHHPEDLEAAGVALPPQSAEAEQPRATRNVSVSRKVSKISATAAAAAGLPTADLKRGSSTPLSAISPSIRQLSERFSSSSSSSSSARAHGDTAVTRRSTTLPRAKSTDRDRSSPSRKSFHEDSSSGGGGYFQNIDPTEFPTETKVLGQKFHSGTDSVSGSDSEKRSQEWICTCLPSDGGSESGKRDYSQINACPSDPRKTLTAGEEEDATPPACKSHRANLSTTHHSDFVPLNSDNWPSVTKIRQLFGERQSGATQQLRTSSDTCDNLKTAGRGHLHPLGPKESSSLSDRSDKLSPTNSASEASCSLPLPERHHHRAGTQSSCTTEGREKRISRFRHGMDLHSKADHQQHSNEEEADIETPTNNNNNNTTVTTRTSFQSNSSSSSSCSSGRYYRINTYPYRAQSPSSGGEAACETLRTTGLTSDPDPDLQPPAPSPWSCSVGKATSFSSSSLQQPRERERRDRQGVGLPRDSLHSSHSSSKAPAPPSSSSSPSSAPAPDKAIASSSTVAPSPEPRAPVRVASALNSHWRFSSGDEEEDHSRRRRGGGGGGVGWSAISAPAPSTSFRGGERGVTERGGGYFSRSKNGWWGSKGIGRSSGSEEDSPGSLGPPSRDVVRRRSLRKKKKVSGVALVTARGNDDDHDGESEDSDSDTAVTMEHLERQHQQNKGGEFAGTAFRNRSTREPATDHARTRVHQREPVTSTSLPGVARVSKVNIPPFISSPGGSRCSSRYSSTETLKEEDHASCANRGANMLFTTGRAGGSTNRTVNTNVASSSMLSKTYHGNFTMYRSPSFGHGDNFSHTPARVRPKIVPTVTPSPTVLPREGGMSAGRGEARVFRRTLGVGGIDDKDKNRISMSNPDIASETLSLLSFLKTDLSELRVRKTSGGDRSGVMEGSTVYRMGSRSQGGTLLPSGRRPSLKDLTATLRRTKSFTYSDKPTTPVICYSENSAKRSSSEQQLDLNAETDGGRVSVSDREVESDGGDFRVGRGQRARDYGYDDEGLMVATPLQDRYVQEARQVIRDICQMSAREEEDDVDVRGIEDGMEEERCRAKQTREEKDREGVSIKDEAGRDREAENMDGDTSERGREGREKDREREGRERRGMGSERMQLEKLDSRDTEYREKGKRESKERHRALQKGDLEESMFYDRSIDELSGHESSLTDEGIVTEPETGPTDPSESSFVGSAGVNLGSLIARDVLGQPVTVWKQSALHEGEGLKEERGEKTEKSVICTNRLNQASTSHSSPLPALRAESDSIVMETSSTVGINNGNTTSEGINTNSTASQESTTTTGGGGLEAPATPSAIRRRRKFSPTGNNNTGSDSSSGSNTESVTAGIGNGESTVYRSLSDPMPQRCCSVVEEGKNSFSSVDSNLLGSLSVKGGGGTPESSSVANQSECKGSVASDLSVCSDGGLRDDSIRDYSGVIRSIVAEPGAMDRLMMDDHGNGKAPKKKSFSDPSRRSDAPLLSQNDPHYKLQSNSTEPISELDQPGQILPSSSEPILSKQREELWEPEDPLPTKPHRYHHGNDNNQVKKPRSQSECTLRSGNHGDEYDDVIDHGEEERVERRKKFNFDLKLAEVLSPRMGRRSTRKRPNRLALASPNEDPFDPPELQQEDHNNQADLTPPLPPLPQPSKPKTRPKHIRHASEPAAFIPISPLPQFQPLKEGGHSAIQPTLEPSILGKPPDEAPSLEDVTKRYILALSAPERDTEGPRLLPGAGDGAEGLVSTPEGTSETRTSGITNVGPQKKGTEDSPSMTAPQQTKPRVMVRTLAQFSITLEEMNENGENTGDEGGGERDRGGEELMDRDAVDRSRDNANNGNVNSNGNGNGQQANTEDMRRHVIMTLLDTEQSYVDSLRTLIQGYMRPLKQPDSIVDPLLVDEMFYQIPEILEHHEHFLEQVTGCVSQWHDRQTVGHLLIQSVSRAENKWRLTGLSWFFV